MTEGCRSERPRPLFLDRGALSLILLSALVAFVATAVAAREEGHITLPLPYVGIDVAMVAYLTAVLAVLQRRRILGGILALVIGNGLLIGSCVKTALLGHPGSFADLLLLPDLMQVLDPTLAFGAGAVMLALLGAYVLNLGGPRSFAERCLLVPLLTIGILAGLLAASPSLARSAALSVPYRANQVYSYFLHAYTAYVKDVNWEHAEDVLQEEGVAALRTAPLGRAVLPPFAPRNLHIVVAESFTDPAWYAGFGLGDAPLPPLFERWRESAASTAVSPVFGGRSANAEFEVLCGLPALVGPSEIVFWRLPPGPLPCLPERLAEAGYATFALHPITRETFNLDDAYPSAGFERTYFESDLDMSDRDGRFLSARSTLVQHLRRVEAALQAEEPVFSYAFVNAAHFPYARDETARPDLLQAPTAPDPVEPYVNAAAYMARAIDRYVSALAARDPESVIVVVGDHAPTLGANFEGFRRGGRIAPDDPWPLARASMYEVPLLILDRGELLPIGRLPTYLIPYVVLDRLSDGDFCRKNGCAWQRPWRLRPFRDFALLVEAEGTGESLCVDSEAAPPSCRQAIEESWAWLAALLDLLETEVGRLVGSGAGSATRES